MWILSFIPSDIQTAVTHLTLLIGIGGIVLGYFLQYIPGILEYRIQIKVAACIALSLGIYLEGCINTEAIWKERVSIAENKVKESEAKAEIASANTEVKIVEKIQHVKDIQYVIKNRIIKEQVAIDADCKISPIAVDIHNKSAINPEEPK